MFPTRSVKNKVLEKIWSGKKPSVNYLKMFGSTFYKHVLYARRKKLYDKSEPTILVGYQKTRDYRLFNPINGRIIAYHDNHNNIEIITQRPQRTRPSPARLHDCEVIGDNKVTIDRDLVHFTLLADVETINHKE